MTTDTSTGEATTYRGWLDWAETSIQGLQDLATDVESMCSQIAADDGDRAQLAALQSWHAQIIDTIANGQRMVTEVHARQVPVGEAVAAAGGSANTPHKEYADEGRPA